MHNHFRLMQASRGIAGCVPTTGLTAAVFSGFCSETAGTDLRHLGLPRTDENPIRVSTQLHRSAHRRKLPVLLSKRRGANRYHQNQKGRYMSPSYIGITQKLEQAVRKDDVQGVHDVFEKHGWVELTARALGIAARSAGPEMVEALLAHDATFDYRFLSTAAKNKYESQFGDADYVDYARVVCPAFIRPHARTKPAPDEVRMAACTVLMDKGAVQEGTLLYYAILYQDAPLLALLEKRKVSKLSSTIQRKIVDGIATWPETRAEREEIRRVLAKSSDATVAQILTELATAADGKIDVERGSLLPPNRMYSNELFEVCAVHGDVLKRVKRMDIALALLHANNCTGMEYLLKNRLLPRKVDQEYLVREAHSREGTSAEMLALLTALLHKSNDKNTGFVANTLSLDGKGTTAKALSTVWGYVKTESGYCIKSYKGDDRVVVIPERIGKTPVTEVAPRTFDCHSARVPVLQRERRNAITSIEYPGSVHLIGGLDDLSDTTPLLLVFNEGAEEIAGAAFFATQMLHEVRVPASLHTIGEAAFQDCGTLGVVAGAIGLETIEMDAFRNCRELERIESLQSLKVLEDAAFTNCKRLERIELPDTLTELGIAVFMGTGLRAFTLPRQITSLPARTLKNCNQLETLHLHSVVTAIEERALSGCSALGHVELGDALESIKDRAFERCEALQTIVLPDSLKTLGTSAFAGCKSLRDVVIPADLHEIPDDAFSGCKALRSLAPHEQSQSAPGEAQPNQGKLILPETICKIGARAFLGTRFHEVQLPESVTIGEDAFAGCAGIADPDGRVVVHHAYYGGAHSPLSAAEAMMPLCLDEKIQSIQASAANCPLIMYRPSAQKGKLLDVSSLEPGPNTTVTFGRFPQDDTYELQPLSWYVLAKEKDRVLLLAERVIMWVSESLQHAGSWPNSKIRAFLNGAFMDVAFSDLERQQLTPVKLHNAKKRSEPDTVDTVFLLSMSDYDRRPAWHSVFGGNPTPYVWKRLFSTMPLQVPWNSRTTPRNSDIPCTIGKYSSCSTEDRRHNAQFLRPALWIRNPERK